MSRRLQACSYDRHFRVIDLTPRKWKIMTSSLGGAGDERNLDALAVICTKMYTSSRYFNYFASYHNRGHNNELLFSKLASGAPTSLIFYFWPLNLNAFKSTNCL